MEINSQNWRSSSRCRQWDVDPEIFFAPEGNRRQEPQAKALCGGCAVRAVCLLTAIQNNERFGIWGGLTTLEREERLERIGTHRGNLTVDDMKYFFDK